MSSWRNSTINEIRDLQAMAVANQEQSLAELRYLKHKIDRLNERTAALSPTPATGSGSGSANTTQNQTRTGMRFREPVPASLVDTLGIPTRFSSLGSSNQSSLPRNGGRHLASPLAAPVPMPAMLATGQWANGSGSPGTADVGPPHSVRLVGSPQSIRQQVERTQREADEIRASMESRVEAIEERTASMRME